MARDGRERVRRPDWIPRNIRSQTFPSCSPAGRRSPSPALHHRYNLLRAMQTAEQYQFWVRIRHLTQWFWCAAGSLCNTLNLRVERRALPRRLIFGVSLNRGVRCTAEQGKIVATFLTTKILCLCTSRWNIFPAYDYERKIFANSKPINHCLTKFFKKKPEDKSLINDTNTLTWTVQHMYTVQYTLLEKQSQFPW